MGANPAETVKEIEETRDRLEADLRALEEHLPRPAVWGKRLVGIAVGAGVTTSAFWYGVRRLRKRHKDKKRVIDADLIAAVPGAVQLVPEQWVERLSSAWEDGQLKTWVVVGAAAWVGLRLMEARQLRTLNRRMMMAQAVGPPPTPF
jgi:hypothetical protein